MLDGAAARRCVGQRRPRRSHHRRAERAALRVRGAGLPGGRGVRAGDRGDHRSAADRADLRDHAAHRPARRHRPSPRCATCSTSTSSWSVASSPSASGRRSSTPPRRRSASTPRSRSASGRGSRRPASATAGPLIGAGAVAVRGMRRAHRATGGRRAGRTGTSRCRRAGERPRMTKIRSTDAVWHRRPARAGRRRRRFRRVAARCRRWRRFPMKAGGGLLGDHRAGSRRCFLPQLLGGGSHVHRRRRARCGEAQAADQADGTCSSELEQIVCGGANDVPGLLDGELPQAFGKRYETPTMTFFTDRPTPAAVRHRRRRGRSTARPTRRCTSTSASCSSSSRSCSAAPATSPSSTSSPTSSATTSRTCRAPTTGQPHEQADPDTANRYSDGARAAGRLLRRGVGQDASSDRGLLDASDEVDEALNAADGVGDDRIQQEAAGQRRPGDVHARHVRAAQEVARRRLHHRRPAQCEARSPSSASRSERCPARAGSALIPSPATRSPPNRR